MRSRSASVLAGLAAVMLIGTVGAHPVLAEPTPTPSTTATDEPSDPPTDPPTTDPPTDPPTDDPPTDPPTDDPTDPPTDPPTDDPTDPPTDPPTDDPTDPPTDNPTDPPKDPSKTPVLSLGLSVSSAAMRPGGSITATVRVSSAKATASGTVLRMSAGGAQVSPQTQNLGSVGGGGASALATVRAPSTAEPGVITLRASVSAARARTVSRSYKLIITAANGALPPGLGPTSLPPGVPPLTGSGFDPLAGMTGPQVALPPVVPDSPEIAPASGPLVPVSNLRELTVERFTVADLIALQAGFLAGLAVVVTLLLLRLRLVRRTGARRAARRRLRAAGSRLAGKRPTAARLRTLPPQPARARTRTVRPVWRPAGQVRAARP